MVYELIPESGRFFKVNMHSHTDISDGNYTPVQVKEQYKALGYHAVAFTDHEILIDHTDLCDDSFVALHGYEVAIKADESCSTGIFMPVYHFNFVAEQQDNLTMPLFYKNNKSFPGNSREWAEKYAKYDGTIDHTEYHNKEWLCAFLKNAQDSGFLIAYNHPQWSLQSITDIACLEGLHAIEVINGGTSILNDNTSIHFEQLLRIGKRIVPNAGDDNHGDRCGFGWTMIKAETLSYDALIDGYKNGNCYATEGPEIKSLVIKDGKVCIKTSPAVCICLFSEGRYVDAKMDADCAEFDYIPEKFGSYFRLEVKDAQGRRAFSNAYYTKDIDL